MEASLLFKSISKLLGFRYSYNTQISLEKENCTDHLPRAVLIQLRMLEAWSSVPAVRMMMILRARNRKDNNGKQCLMSGVCQVICM